MHYGTKSGPEYFDDYDPQAGPVDKYYLYRANTVDHDPTLDDLHARIHHGAIGVIRTYGRDPQFVRLVLAARRILEFDIHNARSPEQRDRYTDDLRDALIAVAD